ncbi:MAG: universal stress protein [Gammaproteobacteria bacterium]|nr:universal stress protein [Gammaproteobacteria bacterium]
MFRNILIAVDLSEVSADVCARGVDVARHYAADVTLLHVVEPIIIDPVYDVLPAIPVELEERHVENARRELAQLGSRFGIERARCRVEMGSTKAEIIRLAEHLRAELIVVASHSRRGVGRLLGSTAASVLHAAACDVLAVHVRE